MTLKPAIRGMSVTDLAALGLSEIAYVRAVRLHGGLSYAIHAADGRPMALAANPALAMEAIESQDLRLVPLH